MVEIEVNNIDKKYIKMADILTKPTNDKIAYDVYNNMPLDIASIDYGFITMVDGSIHKTFIATSVADEYRCISLYFSDDGINWTYLDFPTTDIVTVYSKAVIFEGSVFVLYDDKICRLYDFDFDNSTMKEDVLEGVAYDIIIAKNKLYALAHNGFYNIHKVDDKYEYSELVQVSQDFVFEKFIKSALNELIIMGYAEGFPVFINIFGENGVQPIFCTTAFTIQTAISYKDYIYCYTKDARIVTVYKSPSIDKTIHMIYAGHNWSGEVFYYHSHFWIAYSEFIDNEVYTYIAKSSNGLDFDPDVRIPHKTESDGLFAIACDNAMNNIVCVGAGDIYTLVTSVNYFDYGCIHFAKKTELTEEFMVTIDDFDDIDNFRNYNINVYVVYKNTVLDTITQFDIAPHVENDNIVFKIKDKEYIIPEEPEPETPEEESDEDSEEEVIVQTPETIKVLTIIYGVRTVC